MKIVDLLQTKKLQANVSTARPAAGGAAKIHQRHRSLQSLELDIYAGIAYLSER
jgi:hypothetical protein